MDAKRRQRQRGERRQGRRERRTGRGGEELETEVELAARARQPALEGALLGDALGLRPQSEPTRVLQLPIASSEFLAQAAQRLGGEDVEVLDALARDGEVFTQTLHLFPGHTDLREQLRRVTMLLLLLLLPLVRRRPPPSTIGVAVLDPCRVDESGKRRKQWARRLHRGR